MTLVEVVMKVSGAGTDSFTAALSTQASRGFEPRSLGSESRVLAVTPRGQLINLRHLLFGHGVMMMMMTTMMMAMMMVMVLAINIIIIITIVGVIIIITVS